MNEINPHILKSIRFQLIMSQAEFADEMDMPLRTLEDLEAGRSRVRGVHVNAALWVMAKHHGFNAAIECEVNERFS